MHRIIRRIHSLLKAFGSCPMGAGDRSEFSVRSLGVQTSFSRIDHLDYVPWYIKDCPKNTTVESGIYLGKKSGKITDSCQRWKEKRRETEKKRKKRKRNESETVRKSGGDKRGKGGRSCRSFERRFVYEPPRTRNKISP